MKDAPVISRKAEESGRRARRTLAFDLDHGARNANRTNPRDPLAGTAPAMLPWSAHTHVTGSRVFMKYSGLGGVLDYITENPLQPGGLPKGAPGMAKVSPTRENILAESPDADPMYVAQHRYDPFQDYRPGRFSRRLGAGTRGFAEFIGSRGPVPGALALGAGGAGIGALAGLLGRSRGWNPKLLALVGALVGGGAGTMAGRSFKRASFWNGGASEALMEIVRKAAGLSQANREALQSAVSDMPAGKARQILEMLGPTLGGAGIGALLVKLILGGGNGRMAGGALAGALLANLMRGSGEDPGLDIYGRRVVL